MNTPHQSASVHPARLSPEELWGQCEVEFLRRSGPGGQHRNKVETAVRLRHRPSGIVVQAARWRHQAQNRREALRLLRLQLALQVRTSPPLTQPPSPLWKNRCRQGKLLINPNHEDFPALLAEALDHLAVRDWDVAGTAKHLGITTSQLVKLLKHEPQALALVNRERKSRGLGPLK